LEKGTPKEAEYKFEFPVIKEWKEKDLREFSTNNIRSTMAGELRMAEIKDKGWIAKDLQPVWEDVDHFFVLTNICLFKFTIGDYDDPSYIKLKDLTFTEERDKGERYLVIYKNGVKSYLLRADKNEEHDQWYKKLNEIEKEHKENANYNARPELNDDLRRRIKQASHDIDSGFNQVRRSLKAADLPQLANKSKFLTLTPKSEKTVLMPLSGKSVVVSSTPRRQMSMRQDGELSSRS
jgi:hypothetical protein